MKDYKLIPSLQIVGNDGFLITYFDKIKKFDMDSAGSMDFELVIDKEDYDNNRNVFTYGNFVVLRTEELGAFQNAETEQVWLTPQDNAGMIEKLKFTSSTNEITIKGPTLRGILQNRIIRPAYGDDYYTIPSGWNISYAMQETLSDAERRDYCKYNTAMLIDADFIHPSTTVYTTSEFQFDRYCTYLDGITKFLRDYGMRLNVWLRQSGFDSTTGKKKFDFFIWPDVPKDYSDEMLTNYMKGINYEVELGQSEGVGGDGVNILNGLGKGDLHERQVTVWSTLATSTHKVTYYSFHPTTSDKLYTSPLNIHEDIYDYSNAENWNYLNNVTKEKMIDEVNKNKQYTLSIDPELFEYQLEVNDKIAMYDQAFRTTMSAIVTNKIYRIEGGTVKVEYQLENGESVVE